MFAEECSSTSIQLKAKKLQLRIDTICQRVVCISNDQQKQLLCQSKIFVYYSIAHDTSKDFTDTEQIAVFVWES